MCDVSKGTDIVPIKRKCRQLDVKRKKEKDVISLEKEDVSLALFTLLLPLFTAFSDSVFCLFIYEVIWTMKQL